VLYYNCSLECSVAAIVAVESFPLDLSLEMYPQLERAAAAAAAKGVSHLCGLNFVVLQVEMRFSLHCEMIYSASIHRLTCFAD